METNSNQIGLETPQELAARLHLAFNDLLLVSRALTHRSYLNEHPEALEDNERLEFLGDAVLDFLVGAWLYNHFPEMPEGDLTRMRSALVHTEQLAEFARQINLGHALRLGRGEAQGGGRENGDLDLGIDAVLKFIAPLLEEASNDILVNQKIEDPKSMFQEWVQAQGMPTPVYVTRNSFGPDHSKVFEVDVVVDEQVFGTGTGHGKQAATKAAAKDALQRLGLID